MCTLASAKQAHEHLCVLSHAYAWPVMGIWCMQTGVRASVSFPAVGVLVPVADFADAVGSSGNAPCQGRWDVSAKVAAEAVAKKLHTRRIHIHMRT